MTLKLNEMASIQMPSLEHRKEIKWRLPPSNHDPNIKDLGDAGVSTEIRLRGPVLNLDFNSAVVELPNEPGMQTAELGQEILVGCSNPKGKDSAQTPRHGITHVWPADENVSILNMLIYLTL